VSVTQVAAASGGSVHGFAAALTSLVGRRGEAAEVAGLLRRYRLVTVTGPGGVGKTRLAAEVARQVAGRFADGAWLVELASVPESALVQAAVATALGLRQAPRTSLTDSLTGLLARQQLLLVIDNCEHVLTGVAELCRALLAAADDVRVLATSREPVGVAGEARYRLPPLPLPRLDDQAEIGGSEAVTLFTDRARQADAHFALSGATGPVVARLVQRLDGMPLAIELAAARVESLGVAQLADRLDDRFGLLADGDRTAAPRQRSLAATVDWSYQLLSEEERRVFRLVSVFPAPFTLQAGEAVTGAAGTVVLRLVDCSLLTPPRAGPDGRPRYLMLETLRAYGRERLAEAGEQPGATAALASYALTVAERAAARMQASGGELGGVRWLDAEDAMVHQALAWALQHDRAAALRLAVALAPWWRLRGRAVAGYALLRAAAGHAEPGQGAWCAGQVWLGELAGCRSDFAAELGHHTAVCDARAGGGPSPELADGLAGRASALRNLDRVPEAAQDARRALAVARECGYPAGEALALKELSWACNYAGDAGAALEWARQAQRIDPAGIPGWIARGCDVTLTTALLEAGQAAAARLSCAEGLARARDSGDLGYQSECLWLMAEIDRRAGRLSDAGVHVRESVRVAAQTGERLRLIDCLNTCGHLCAAAGRWAEAITLWAAHDAAHSADMGLPDLLPLDAQRRQAPLRKARQALPPAQTRAAEQRGAAMTLATAVEFATVATAADSQAPQEQPGLAQLSAREQELVTLVAQGATDAQIAKRLYISVRTVRSHLDRIRDKTGCRRRADLTRLALQAGLV
jgi:predicted ATPase/DNA-binding CsgD family transcriptional regulator